MGNITGGICGRIIKSLGFARHRASHYDKIKMLLCDKNKTMYKNIGKKCKIIKKTKE